MALPVTPVTPGASSTGDTALQSAAAATGNGTSLQVSGMGAVIFTVSGTFAATITFEGTEDGTNWTSLKTFLLGTDTLATTTTTTGTFEAACAGLQLVRARVSSYSSGSVTVTANATVAPANPRTMDIASVGGTAVLADSGSNAMRVSLQAQGTPVTGSAAVAANNSNSAALPAVTSKTNYITGFSVTTTGGTGAAAGAVTITGVITGTLTYEAGAAANTPVQMFHTFPSPIPASAANTAITVNVPALGANTGAAACTVYGFVQ